MAATVLAADWPQFLGPRRSGVSTETGLIATWPKDGPPKLWDKSVGAGFSSPVVAGERLILFHRLDNNEVVECLDPATGRQRWKFAYESKYVDDFGFDEGPRSTPVIAGERVYTLGADGDLHCLELETGKKVWERRINTDYQVRKGFFGVGTSPLVDDGRLFINVGGKDAGIVALDAGTGKELWKATRHEASYSSPVIATVAGTRHLVFLTREGIVSLDPATGAVRFSKQWRSKNRNSVNAATPLVVDDVLFVSAEYNTGAFAGRIGKDSLEELWSGENILSNHYNTSIAHNGYLYGIDGRADIGVAQLRCVELKTGKVKWSESPFGCAALLLADERLIALTEKGDVVLIDATPDAYREKARAALLEKPCRSAPALSNGRLFARDPKRLVCWNVKK
jgi:outer membrane protein assembly factor BamB